MLAIVRRVSAGVARGTVAERRRAEADDERESGEVVDGVAGEEEEDVGEDGVVSTSFSRAAKRGKAVVSCV